jgi:hypothetical protein
MIQQPELIINAMFEGDERGAEKEEPCFPAFGEEREKLLSGNRSHGDPRSG